MVVSLHPEALKEYMEAVAFYEERAPGLGREFFHEVERVLRAVGGSPAMGSPLAPPFRRALCRRFPSVSVGRRAMRTKSKSQTITRGSGQEPLVERRLPTHRPPTHPGEMLLEEFLKPLGITQSAFAIQLGVSFPRLNEVINAKRSVTPDTALRLARVTGMSADFWLGLQQDWDLWHALRSESAKEIAALKPLKHAS